MKPKLILPLLGLLAASLVASPAAAQATNERIEALRARMGQVKEFFGTLSEDERRAFSGSAQNLMHLAERWGELEEELQRPAGPSYLPSFTLPAGPAAPLASISKELAPVSDPRTDFVTSVLAGFTQSETSTGWCGHNVVVGFNDSGSLAESTLMGPGGGSFNGVARSTDMGETFTDLGFLNPGPNFFDFLSGDPVVACTSENTFYYASLFETGTPANPLTAISLSRSTDGGLTFGNPIVAVSKSARTHFLDKPWMTADSTDANRIFVTYTDFDTTGDPPCGRTPGGAPIRRTAIELVRTTNGGGTWSTPIVLAQICGSSFVQGSQVAVGASGEVYVLWESFIASFFGPRALRIRRSVDHGATFGTSVKVDDVIPTGEGFRLQGGFRDFLSLALAVDRSGGPTRGFVYVVWSDGRNLQVPDFAAFNGFYAYADILVRRSTNGGVTWSAPVRVNNNAEPLADGRGSDQYQPGIAVDRAGKVGICFYDRRRDEHNFLFDRFCAVSRDAGTTWRNKRITEHRSAPWHAVDVFINTQYFGDYDALASDFLGGRGGFIGAFQVVNTHDVFVPNPDVKAARVHFEEEEDDD